MDLPWLWNTPKNLMFPWKYSPFDQTKPALFPLSVTRSYLLPVGPQSFLPIKPGLRVGCAPEASATTRSLQHTTRQKPASIRALKGCKTSCAERRGAGGGKQPPKMPGSFAKHFLLICSHAKSFAVSCRGHQKVTPQQPWEAGPSLPPAPREKGWGRACAPEKLQ